MAAAKAGGGQQPLAREARRQLDALLAEMPLPYRDRSATADGPRTVHVTGFYTGHPFTRPSAEAVAARLRNQPLARGVALEGVYHDHEDALIILHHHNYHHPHHHHDQNPPEYYPHQQHQLADLAPPSDPGPCAPSSAEAASPPAAAASLADTPPAPGTPTAAVGAVSLEGEAETAGAAAAAAVAAGLRSGTEGSPAAVADPAAGPEPDAPAAAVPTGGAGEAVFGPLVSSGAGGRQDSACMAVMLLEYGGVVLFNVPESLQAEALSRVAAAALPDAKPAEAAGLALALPRQPPLRGVSRGPDSAEAAWRQAVADKLSLHKEEQLIVVDPATLSGCGRGRWIRKVDDSLHIWSWDSTNLESIARVLSQSAAIRYYNQECEDMLERYETIMPLGYESPEQQRLSITDRLLFWRSRLPLRDLRQMVFKSSGIRVRLDSRLGLRDPPSGSWESTRHHAVWEAMRREFELDDRRDLLMEKTELLKQSCLDLISANNESFTKRSELSIILLITLEIVISLTDLHSALSAENVGRALGWALQGLGLGRGSGA